MTRRVSFGSFEFGSAFQRAGQGKFIGVFNTDSSGEAVGDASNFQMVARQPSSEVMAGGIPFDIGAEGNDHFGDGFAAEALFEFFDAEVFRFHTI